METEDSESRSTKASCPALDVKLERFSVNGVIEITRRLYTNKHQVQVYLCYNREINDLTRPNI